MTNTVLMPVCALFACIVVGWIIKPEKAVEELVAICVVIYFIFFKNSYTGTNEDEKLDEIV